MKKISLMLSLLALFASSAFAGGPVNVRSIKVEGLNAYNGKYVTAYYLSARASGFSYGNNSPRINRVLEKSSPIKISGGKAIIPRTNVIESGFSVLNYLKFVVHNSNTNIILKNIDGSTPPGKGQSGGSTRYVKGFYVAKAKVSPISSPAPATVNP
jgi:hypothetical protein